MRRSIVFAASIAAALWGPAAGAQDAPSQPLWAGAAPGAQGSADTDVPTITPYLPTAEVATGTAVVVFPGGGYQHLAADHEGRQIATWLSSLGIAAFVVHYRVGPTYRHPVEIQDAQRAIRTVRARAEEWKVDPARVGVIGFSAGGHLASTTGTHHAESYPVVGDAIDAQSPRPDFMMLIYPVITLQSGYAHQGSRRNLLGEAAGQSLVWALSNDLRVTPDTPPTFLVHTTDDPGVPVENSLLFYQAMRRAGAPVEMHLFESGPHGFGLGRGNPSLSQWAGLAETWLRVHGWLGWAER